MRVPSFFITLPSLTLGTLQAYASVLTIAPVLKSNPSTSKMVYPHMLSVLFVLWALYVYRDVWPLATYTLQPIDAHEGPVLWVQIFILTLVAVVIPVVTPRGGSELKDTPGRPDLEETASLWSLVTYSFLDNVIWKASQMPHLPFDGLPPLAFRDRAEDLVRRMFPYLDPFQVKKRRNIGIGLLTIFKGNYLWYCVLYSLRIGSRFVSPIGIYKLLEYVETKGEGATIRPWVWVAWLFVGPMVGTLALQFYMFSATRLLAQSQAILTQLIFNHALRIRVKSDAPQAGSSSAAGGSKPSASGSMGKIYTLATADVNNIVAGREFLTLFFLTPLQILFSMIFLNSILGWSAMVGLATIIMLLPIPGKIAQFSRKAQSQKMRKTDARVQEITEVTTVIRMIKLFAWERRTAARLDEKREEELVSLRKFSVLGMVNRNVTYFLPIITMISTFFTYTVIMGNQLTASRVFSAMTVFDIIRSQLESASWILPDMTKAKVSLDRVTAFLYDSELLDEHTPDAALSARDDVLGVCNTTFAWSRDGLADADARPFALRVGDELRFERGHVNVVVGPTGSGKTALLLGLLGEMHAVPGGPDAYVGLPRAAGIAYVPQEAWIQSDTIKANIVFGAPMDEDRYQQVLHQCCLGHDLGLFEDGDLTQIGERGITLSGGQKARVSLARAVYSSADTVLIDDVFAALDVHTSRWILEKCLNGNLMRGRTVILVTHHVALLSRIASYMVVMGTSGQIATHGKWEKVAAEDREAFAHHVGEDEKELAVEAEAEESQPLHYGKAVARPAPHAAKNLVAAEEVSVGHVAWPAIRAYFSSMGGHHRVLFWTAVVTFIIASQLLAVLQTYWLGYWALQYSNQDPSNVHESYFLGIYALLLAGDVSLLWAGYLVYLYGTLRAARTIHRDLVDSILGSTLRWLDTIPSSRIITRCISDIQTLDGPLANSLRALLEQTASMAAKFAAIIFVSPAFALPGAIFAVVGRWAGLLYIKAQLPVKREQSNKKAPILSHLGATVAGLVSVRAYGAQDRFIKEAFDRMDDFSRATRTLFNLNRWISLRLEALSSLIAACLGAYLIYWTHSDAATTGFALNMADILVGFSGMILWWIRNLNDFEVNGTLERVEQYKNIEHEPAPTPSGVPPAYWPASGSLRVERLSARYSTDGPTVLHGISFEIKSGERVGIVGRTGSGKSSLALALLRLIFTEGEVYLDGIRTDTLNLDALRSSITIIPQIPELLSGTLRRNLDPSSSFSDADALSALRTAGVSSLQRSSPPDRDRRAAPLTLDAAIAPGGANLSVGQRQIVALARALLRGCKLLVLDEATSAIDYKTDAAIQRSLREVVARDVTVLTIAHRLQTVMDADKILVLDSGRVAEFGAPAELLTNQDGHLTALVNESGDKDALLAMAAAASAREDVWITNVV
ncbi:P-loop containing nucleoside triphosphate hydrolase protein [Epithele typhae]|uniref:P-loop containing nucleoside triphosphate hydrolase protein n=1 Tax=Epithele typhae TaxID=378194 RepID=UPI002008B77C|nr:P-loop containing nucleoside triphosphate hydrolase protein [Epithele typhae]KAH9939288.1 P-loop containing nucleoside triphosphate hydrolase protein [Epithele typhae]